MRYASINVVHFESCNVGSFFVLSNSGSATGGQATTTATVPNPVTVLSTSTLQAVPSTQPQVNHARQKGPNNIWEIVAGVLLAVAAVCVLILIAYCWRRRRNAKLKTDEGLSGKRTRCLSRIAHRVSSSILLNAR
jgi:H+/gluconate symporter-like permease